MSDKRTCPVCYGAGKRTVNISFWGFPERRTCYRCNGSGQVKR